MIKQPILDFIEKLRLKDLLFRKEKKWAALSIYLDENTDDDKYIDE